MDNALEWGFPIWGQQDLRGHQIIITKQNEDQAAYGTEKI